MSGHTKGPWIACNMIHAEHGGPMTPDELGEYVKNNVLKSIENGGSATEFLFISTEGDDVPDICHVGNGPRRAANARLIAAAPELLEALRTAEREIAIAAKTEPQASIALATVRAAIAKAEGQTSLSLAKGGAV